MKKLLLSVFLLLAFCAQAQAESSVWKASKGNSVVYIGGTVHILRQSDYPLPEEYQEAYTSSDMLVFETDIDDPSMAQKVLSRALYMDGSTLEQHISAETFKTLKEYCEANGASIDQFKQLKPAILSTMLLATELAKLGISPDDGVDKFFYQSGKKDNKTIETLETIDYQLDLMFKLTEGKEDETITQIINEVNSIKEMYDSMVAAWKTGDAKNLYDLFLKETKTQTPELYKITFSDRNNNWLPKIINYFDNQKTEFILVGVGHLVGPDGVIEQLIRKGYKVEKL